ncbi:predicted protein [Nematostella vectensis]|uniref:Uncharacterized protein n=1 Tax=Nematostella vectensis TaxID=45351 RepID=A7RNZ5_NEMVE|nr:uncharacterized protein LOC5518958 [Nematostella vectensis]EDO46766.1 predicted protein [Nematostella vectensis]|eukprot:XP_001638829.1 predicted protein [Nematostella vectensis]
MSTRKVYAKECTKGHGQVTMGNIIAQLEYNGKTMTNLKRNPMQGSALVKSGVILDKSNKVRKGSMNIEAMRKSLQKQIEKQNNAKKNKTRRIVENRPRKALSCYVGSEGESVGTLGDLSTSQSRISSARTQTRVQEFNTGITLPGKGTREEYTSTNEEDNSGVSSKQRGNIYSRHLDQEESESVVNSTASGGERKLSSVSRKTVASSQTSTKTAIRISLSQGNVKTARSDDKQEEREKERNKKPENEEEFIKKLSDPSLKSSLEKIIQKRRNSVKFVTLQSGGIRVINHEDLCSVITEEESKISVLESEVEQRKTPTLDTSSEASTSRRAKDNTPMKDKECKGRYSPLDRSSQASGKSFYSMGIAKEYDSTDLFKNRYTSRDLSSALSHVSSRSGVTRKSTQKNKKEIMTEETRVILPMSAKKYRPILTASKEKRRVRSAYCASRNKEDKLLDHRDIVRDFLVMYAKVKTDSKKKADFMQEYKETCEVRMMSATPEFVVKSAIGQFLTRAFPSGKTESYDFGKDQKYEDLQRTKLLKIKTCMQQLASLA